MQLKNIGMLILESSPEGDVTVNAMGALYDGPVTCLQAVDAALKWASSIDRKRVGSGNNLSVSEFEMAGPHIRAFLDGMGSSFWWRRELPSVVAVPGVGRWIFEIDPTAGTLSRQGRVDLMEKVTIEPPSKTQLQPAESPEVRQP